VPARKPPIFKKLVKTMILLGGTFINIYYKKLLFDKKNLYFLKFGTF
jgi:hypothetical protein